MTAATVTDPFTDGTRFADLHRWRAEAVRLHEVGPIDRIEARQDSAPVGYGLRS